MGQIDTTTPEIDEHYTRRNNSLISKEKEFETEIGDDKEPLDFFPQWKIKRWENESNFSLRLQNVGNHRSGTVSASGNKVRWSGGGLAMNFERILRNGIVGLDWSIEIPNRPAANRLRFSIQTKGLRFLFQEHVVIDPPGREGSSFRPDNVKGSYAVYHTDPAKKYSITGGKQYKTGKAFHLYRPKAVDALGAEIWADLDVNEAAGILTITIDNQWLNDATYPVVI